MSYMISHYGPGLAGEERRRRLGWPYIGDEVRALVVGKNLWLPARVEMRSYTHAWVTYAEHPWYGTNVMRPLSWIMRPLVVL